MKLLKRAVLFRFLQRLLLIGGGLLSGGWGMGFAQDFRGGERAEGYLKSVERIRVIAVSKSGASVSLSNHPGMASTLERYAERESRSAGAPHLFIDPRGFSADLRGFKVATERNLQEEPVGPRLNWPDDSDDILKGG